MDNVKFTKGSVIHNQGDPLSQILFITEGSVEATFSGHKFLYENGDILGILDLSSGIHSSTYVACTDVSITAYPYKNLSALDTLFGEKSAVAYLMVSSMSRKLYSLLQLKDSLKSESARTFNSAGDLYNQYIDLCGKFGAEATTVEEISELTSPTEPDNLDQWVSSYYMEMTTVDKTAYTQFFNDRPALALGFIRKASEDALIASQACAEYKNYLNGLSGVYLGIFGNDLFTLISQLHLDTFEQNDADPECNRLMAQLIKIMSGMSVLDTDFFNSSLGAYKEQLNIKIASRPIESPRETETETETKTTTETETETGSKNESETGAKTEIPFVKVAETPDLEDSLDIILKYAGCDVELYEKFTNSVSEFAKVGDKASSDETVHSLRKQLTVMFYEVYQNALFRRIKERNNPSVVKQDCPTVVKMFLNFGYVDAELAGPESANFLYSIADDFKGNHSQGVYTLPEWMEAIYHGAKEPSRSEFDVDYTEYLRLLKKDKRIDAAEEKKLMADFEGKLRYELENAFRTVNRVTSGAMSYFCPLLSDHNVMRTLDSAIVTPASLKSELDDILSIDFSAFYRETVYSNQKLGIINNVITVEARPEIILLPNIGIRGMMWQEICGKVRTTPSRMFLPVFLQTDLKTMTIQLVGEFRWEMCKRVQGSRWSDVTDPSLTAEYVDYLQFFTKNRDLSQEARTLIRSELARARNNYRSVFVSNYADWLKYESQGLFRLNKIASKILYMYCPFPAETREKLIQTVPRHVELAKRFNVKQFQRTKYLTNLIQKINQGGHPAPQEILDELEYIKR